MEEVQEKKEKPSGESNRGGRGLGEGRNQEKKIKDKLILSQKRQTTGRGGVRVDRTPVGKNKKDS